MSVNYTDHSDHDHDHDHDHHDHDAAGTAESQPQSGLTAREWQIVSIVTIPIIAALGIFCSAYLSRYKDSLLLVCSTIFAGGIVLAVGISHMLPESQEVLEDSFGGFPMSYTLFGACYIFLLFVDAGADRWSETLVHKGDIKATQNQEKDIVCAQDESNDNADVEKVHDHDGDTHDHVHSGHDIANPWAGLLLTIVLSIHSILECLVLGSSADVQSTISMYISIATHKFFASFALGCSLVESGYWIKGHRRRFYTCSLTFILLNVISIGVGMGLSETFSEHTTVIGILNALVAGSFFYVGAAEFVPVQMGKMRALRLPVLPVMLSLISGYLLMVLLTAYTHPEHDHGDHEGHDHF